MFRPLKMLLGLGLAVASAPSAWAFSLLGPFPASTTAPDGYQQPVIAYQLIGDIGTPKNLGEEYRWNTPTLYWACDQNFLDYFGSNGVFAIEQAMAIINGLTNVSVYSNDLSQFPLEARRINYRAQATSLIDLKSVVLSVLCEQLGLAEPVRWTWCLRYRETQPGLSCPFMYYGVIKRNFDPVTWEPSSYVNGTLYSYYIYEDCGPTPPPAADAIEFPVDPLSFLYGAVADLGIFDGIFYTGLTRDDVGGLRYLWRTNNMNVEQVAPDAILVLTNKAANPVLVFPSNLTELAMASLTNSAAALTALYPGLIVASSSNYFVNEVATNLYAYFTNFPWSSAGSAAALVIVTNRTTNVVTRYQHTFANVVSNHYSTNGCFTAMEMRVEPAPWAPPGNLRTNISTKTVCTNLVMGDYWIVPTNLCDVGYSIISTQLVTVDAVTNISVVATNAPGVTNVNGQEFQRSEVYYFTNYIYVAYPVVCEENSVALRQGMERIQFVRRDYDSLLGQYFHPITNQFTLIAVTNNQPVLQTFRRVVTNPDLLFTASDLAQVWLARSIDFNQSNVLAGLAGPGTIQPSFVINLNKVGPMLQNIFDPFLPDYALTEEWGLRDLNRIWGLFDGSTNEPVVFPQGSSIVDLENQVLMAMAPQTLTDALLDRAYGPVRFTGAGGQPPYTWARSPSSPGLPPGLSFVAGELAGTPTVAGTYDFTIRMTDAGGRFLDRLYTLRVAP